MTANFWDSSHCTRWILPAGEVDAANPEDRGTLSLRDIKKVSIHYLHIVRELAERIGLRQAVAGTAAVYFNRFYIKQNFTEFHPSLVAPTCLFLAAKVLECNTHARVIVRGMTSLDWPFSMHNLLEYEYYVLEEMDFYLIVYQPYDALVSYLPDTGLAEECLETAWHIVNDSFQTPVLLLHPPHIVALAATLLASYQHGHDLQVWFCQLNVEMEPLWDVVERLLDLYELQKELLETGVPLRALQVIGAHTLRGTADAIPNAGGR